MAKRKRPPKQIPKPPPGYEPKEYTKESDKLYTLTEFMFGDGDHEPFDNSPASQWVIDALGFDPDEPFDPNDDDGYGDGQK